MVRAESDPRMVTAVIFDVDGTLVDSNDLHAAAWRDAFRRFGKEVPWDKLRRNIGKGSDQYLPCFLSPGEVGAIGEALAKNKSEIYRKNYFPQARPFPGVRQLLERIRRDGARTALATSAEREELQAMRQLLDIEDLLNAQTSAADAERSKPAPDIFAAALAQLGNPPAQDVLVVGDTPYDVQAARQLGLATIGLLCGGFNEEELRRSGCCALYRDPADLLAHYDDSPLPDRRRCRDRRAA